MDTKKLLQRKPSDDPMTTKKKKKKNVRRTVVSPRSPLQDLNGGAAGTISCSSSSSRGDAGYSSSSTSTSTSSGSLRLFISSPYTSGNVQKPRTTTKSVHSSKAVLAPPSCIRSNRSGKENLPKQVKVANVKTNPLKQKISADLRVASGRKLDLLKVVKTADKSEDGAVEHASTPTPTPTPTVKVECPGLSCEFGNKVVKLVEEGSTSETNNTPPIQQSVSPEIQGGTTIPLNAATPACYGTGHLLSGVTDRRKCRARGILTVGRYDPDCSDSNNIADLHGFSNPSLVAEPLEASMRWLCFNEENGDQKDVSGLPSFSSPSLNQTVIPGISKAGEHNCNSSKSSIGQTRVPSLSGDHQMVERFLVKDSSPATATREVITTFKESNWSPFSIDSLDSENVIQTPESDSISNHCKGVSLHCFDSLDLQGDYHYPEIQSLEVLVRENLSPSLEESKLLPLAYDSSFQFNSPILSSNSMENFQQLPNTEDNYCGIYYSSSQASISLKDGLTLTSGITDIDDPDYCKCLSDDDSC